MSAPSLSETPAPSATTRWERPRTLPPLAPGELQVWRCALDVDETRLGELVRLLSPDERARTRRFARRIDAERYAVGRVFMRMRLAALVGVAPEAIVFAHGVHGKPALDRVASGAALAPPLFFNLSHARDVAVLALSPQAPVGVDVEAVRDDVDVVALARLAFSPAERAELAAVSAECRTRAFFAGWTRKEAVVKAIGCGLSQPLERFTVSLSATQPALLALDGSAVAAASWWLGTFTVDALHVGALALPCRPTLVRFIDGRGFAR